MDYVTNRIYIRTHSKDGKVIPPESIDSTVYHEIQELVKKVLRVQIKHDDIDRFEAGMYEVLKSNGWLKFDL